MKIFPGHGIRPADLVQDLSIGRRQIVEVARAFTETDERVRLIILDEPTSSLDPQTSGQLLTHMRRAAGKGIGIVFISHFLGEVLNNSDRIVVMRDGKSVMDDPASHFDYDRLVVAMGGASAMAARSTSRSSGQMQGNDSRLLAQRFRIPLPARVRSSDWPAWPARDNVICCLTFCPPRRGAAPT